MKKYIELKYSFIPGIGLYAIVNKYTWGVEAAIIFPFIIIEITFNNRCNNKPKS
tara:strand:- start:1168 stop:1329 length:162 start_codon:yes stop_codon:yes gene_type:complete